MRNITAIIIRKVRWSSGSVHSLVSKQKQTDQTKKEDLLIHSARGIYLYEKIVQRIILPKFSVRDLIEFFSFDPQT